ncbi:unnamed protein product [Arabidopsis halleri]
MKMAVEIKNDSEYWYKKWEMKRGQGKEDSELERALMTDDEIEIWAKEKDVQAEAMVRCGVSKTRFPTGRSRGMFTLSWSPSIGS